MTRFARRWASWRGQASGSAQRGRRCFRRRGGCGRRAGSARASASSCSIQAQASCIPMSSRNNTHIHDCCLGSSRKSAMDSSHHGDEHVNENTLNAEELKREEWRKRLEQIGLTPVAIWLILVGNLVGLFFDGATQPPFLHP